MTGNAACIEDRFDFPAVGNFPLRQSEFSFPGTEQPLFGSGRTIQGCEIRRLVNTCTTGAIGDDSQQQSDWECLDVERSFHTSGSIVGQIAGNVAEIHGGMGIFGIKDFSRN